MRTLREIAVQNGRGDMPISLGCSGQSTREVIAESRQAAEAGADYVLVLVPSYFHFAMNEDAIVSFFQEVRLVTWDHPKAGMKLTLQIARR